MEFTSEPTQQKCGFIWLGCGFLKLKSQTWVLPPYLKVFAMPFTRNCEHLRKFVNDVFKVQIDRGKEK